MTDYTITQTVPAVYLDKLNHAVTGYTVYAYFPEFDETHTVNVPDLNPANVDVTVKALLTNRRALAKLGSNPGK